MLQPQWRLRCEYIPVAALFKVDRSCHPHTESNPLILCRP